MNIKELSGKELINILLTGDVSKDCLEIKAELLDRLKQGREAIEELERIKKMHPNRFVSRNAENKIIAKDANS